MKSDLVVAQKTLFHFRMFRGRSKAGEPASIIYLGVKEGLIYIAPFVEQRFFEHSSIEQEGTLELTQLGSFLQQTQADMIFLMLPGDTIRQCCRSGDIVGVSRIHQEVDVSCGWEYVLSQLSHRENKRRVRSVELGFHFDVSFEDQDFYYFYRAMHVPTMNARYGCFARSVQEQDAYQELFKRGVLFRVYQGDEWVAGSVSHIEESTRTLNARLIGVKEGAAVYRDNGAQNYVYHSILEWAATQQSIDRVDFQGCEPFLSKGTFQYKKRFGTRAVIPDNAFGHWRLLIRVQTLGASTRQFLTNNPLLGEDKEGGLQAQYFFDAKHAVRSDIPFASKGIDSKVCHNLDQWHD
ncbi:hypothetical protein [Pseudomonas fluorescens]|uniref:hypothetical protein n=1 Tax=Pseudomonas fluorescens TaxID=294 RepID=UPI003D1F3C87